MEYQGEFWTKKKLIERVFEFDTSGNPLEYEGPELEYSNSGHFMRSNPKLITKSMTHEFVLVVGIMFPDWEEAKIQTYGENLYLEEFELDDADHYCICTKKITHRCKLVNAKTKMSLQVGNECIKKHLPTEFAKVASTFKIKSIKRKEEREAKMKQDEIDYIQKEIAHINAEHARQEQEKIDNIIRIKELYHLLTHKPCVSCKLYLLEKQDWKTLCKQCYFRKL
jgi:hypothetical protein